MSILVTGGAGYIGSHVVKQLLEKGEQVVVIDNLSTGRIETIKTLQNIKPFKFIEVDLKEVEKINNILKDNDIKIIMHFAASIVVPESVENPLKYYTNNTVNSTNLIKCAVDNNINKFIFSSTAAVYGNPIKLLDTGVDENEATNPINPYGMSKLMSEKIIQDTAKAHKDFKFVIFRYFNVAGSDISYENGKLHPRIGQSFPNATHLIKMASEAAIGKRDKMYIFGTDYNTIDGTGVRDYIHVDDLANAHIKAIEYLDFNNSDIFNVGYGKGYSVKEVIEVMKRVSNTDFKVDISDRRAGDTEKLISNNNKIKTKMNWKPQYENLELICESAYKWEINLLKLQ